MAKRHRAGFSMVELVVTAGIVLVLGAVTLPAMGRAQKIRENVTCVSNLRQIGMGILCYANDNEGMLPGPLYSGQYPWWSGFGPWSVEGGHWTQLASYVSPYLELKKSRTKWNGDDVFVCPAFKRAVKQIGQSPVYAVNIQVPMGEELVPCTPFGYPNSMYPEVFNTEEDYPPMRMTALVDICDPNGRPAQGSTWMLKDIDQEDERFKTLPAEYFYALPAERAHGNHRNALFFDFHVAAVDRER